MKFILSTTLLILLVSGLNHASNRISPVEIYKATQEFRQADEYRILREFFQLLSIPNVSVDRKGIRKNAKFIMNLMQRRGIRTRILETPGNPVVFGELRVADANQTLMFYIHYDGQPVDPARWIESKPFSPVLRPGKLNPDTGLPKPVPLTHKSITDNWRIYARSSSDDKAPIIALLTAIDAIKRSGLKLKNNIKFILDGEEETGSPNLQACLKENQNVLKSDVLFMCDGPTYFTGDPTLFFGCRGITSLEITVYGSNINLHSGHFGNWAPNPALQLSSLLAGMKDESGRITIEGFYEQMVPLSAKEIEALGNIPSCEVELKELYGFSGTEGGGKSLMEAIQYPSLNINGLQSGWVGDQARTIIPASATASIDIRLVRGNTSEDLLQKLIRHISRQGFHVTETEPDQHARRSNPQIARVRISEKGYPAYKISLDHPVCQRIIKTLKTRQHRRLVLIPSLGGSLPISMFAEILKAPIIGLPIANHDNNQHQPNENLRIGNLWDAIDTFGMIMMMDRIEF